MKRLHPNRKLTLIELSGETGKDYANLSKLITTLEKLQLVETEKASRKRGRPYRIIGLTPRARRIISSIVTETKPKAKYDPAAVDLCLDVMEDTHLDEETRMLYAETLHTLFLYFPGKMLKEHEPLRKTLEETLQDPSAEGKVEERKRSMIKQAIPQLIKDEKTRPWVINTVYPQAIETLETGDKPERILMWTLSMLESIGTRSKEHQEEIRSKTLEMYFNKPLEKMNDLRKELQNSIMELFCQETESARQLATHLRNRTKSANSKEKEKATTLLKKIIQYLVPVPTLQVQ
jgi:DNA-binding MarR family transcriptional regulator